MQIDTEKYVEVAKMYAPAVLFNPSFYIMGMNLRAKSLNDSYAITMLNYEKYRRRAIRAIMPNNWLKMHGYPMRRKIRK